MANKAIPQHKKLAMGKKVGSKAFKKGGVVKGKPVKVKHVAMKKGGKAC